MKKILSILLVVSFINADFIYLEKEVQSEKITLEYKVKPVEVKLVEVRKKIKNNECGTFDRTTNTIVKYTKKATTQIENFVEDKRGQLSLDSLNKRKAEIKELEGKCEDYFTEKLVQEFEHTYDLNGIIIKKIRKKYDNSMKKIKVDITISDI